MALFSTRMPLVLASASPRRKEFLKNLGLTFECAPSGDEPVPANGNSPLSFALEAARAKALFAAAARPDAAVIGADTVVSLDGGIFGKPRDPEHALAMLSLLNNRTHQVISACALVLPREQQTRQCHGQADVTFWNVPDEALRAYAYGPEPVDKAGAYAIQGQGAFLVSRVEGSVSAVVGLPLAELIALLQKHEVIA